MPNSNDMTSEVGLGSWRFSFKDTINVIDVENTTRPYERMKVACAIPMRHADLEMFARGWVACRDYA